MTRLVHSELFKLRTTRTFYGITLGPLALVVAISAVVAATAPFDADDLPVRQLLEIAGIAQTFAVLLGVLAVTSEFRHGTITPSLLVVPHRLRLLAAKLLAHTASGMALGLVAYATCAALVIALLDARGIATRTDSADVAAIVAGGTLATGLLAAIGVGFGALVGNQVGAIVTALAWLFVLEPLLGVVPELGDAIARYGLNGAAGGLAATTADETADVLGRGTAALLMLGYVVAFAVAGAARLQRRDVTA